MSSIEISYVTLQKFNGDPDPDYFGKPSIEHWKKTPINSDINEKSFIEYFKKTPIDPKENIQILKCDNETKTLFNYKHYDFYEVKFKNVPGFTRADFDRTGELRETYLFQIENYKNNEDKNKDDILYIQIELPEKLYQHLTACFKIIYSGYREEDKKIYFVPVIFPRTIDNNDTMYKQQWVDKYPKLGNIYWAAVKNYVINLIHILTENMHYIEHVPDESVLFDLNHVPDTLGRNRGTYGIFDRDPSPKPLYVWFSNMANVFNPNEPPPSIKDMTPESKFIREQKLFKRSIGIVISPQHELNASSLEKNTMENVAKIAKEYKMSPYASSPSHLSSSSSSRSSSSASSSSRLSSSESSSVPIPFDDKNFKRYIADLGVYFISDELKYHIKHRFATLDAILQSDPLIKVRFPRDDATFNIENKALAQLAKDNGKKIYKLEHQLGTGRAVEQWGKGREFAAIDTIDLISMLLEKLEGSYKRRIEYGMVGDGEGVHGEYYIHVCEANNNNVFGDAGTVIIKGEDQISKFTGHEPGVFGIVTTPVAGFEHIVENTNKYDKALLKSYNIQTGGNKFSEYKKIKSDYIQLKKYYKIK